MKILLFTAAYFVARLLLTTNPAEAIASSFIFGVAIFGASTLAQVQGLWDFLDWARKHPGEGLMSVAAPVAMAVMSSTNGAPPLEVALYSPVMFAWFWMFCAVGTHFRERRLKNAVDAELARRAQSESRRDAL